MTVTKKSPKWRTVLVGCGGVSRAWIDPIKAVPEIQLVGLVDIHRLAAEKLSADREITEVEIGTDLDAMLIETKANLLIVCTIPEAHKPNILSGLRHGCHVLTEKPLTSTMAEARAVVAAARKAKRTVAVAQNYRYQRALRSLKKFIASGKIGGLTGLDADFYIGPHFGGFREQMKHVLLLDMGIHLFDMARLLSGDNPVAVTAHEWNPSHSWYKHGASAAAIFEFKNGVVFNYRGSWCSQGLATPWNGTWRILGEKGSVRWDGVEKFEAEVVVKEGMKWVKKPVPVPLLPEKQFPVARVSIIRDFIRCLDKKTEPETVITDNIHSLAMVHGAIDSAQKKRRLLI